MAAGGPARSHPADRDRGEPGVPLWAGRGQAGYAVLAAVRDTLASVV